MSRRLRTALKAAITYPTAAIVTMASSVAATLPFTGTEAVLAGVAAFAAVGFGTTVLADSVTFGRRGGAS